MRPLWKRRKKSISSLYTKSSNLPGVSPGLGAAFGTRRKNPYLKKLALQMSVCLVIALLAIGVVSSDNKFGQKAEAYLHDLLTREINYRPAFQKIVDLSLRYKNFDWPLIEEPSSPPTVTVTSDSSEDLMSLPVSGKISRPYGWVKSDSDNRQRYHEGIDITAKAGTSVDAVLAGKVANTGEDKILGKYVIIEHNNKLSTLYASLANIEVKQGDAVKEGQAIAEVGHNAEADTAHLHFEVREKDQPIDPVAKIKSK